MLQKNHRIIIDTNLWLSFFISKDYSKIIKIIEHREIIFLFSQQLLEEFIQVSKRPKFSKIIFEEDLNVIINELNITSEVINVSSDIKICRDQKDNFLINLAVDGKATHIITWG